MFSFLQYLADSVPDDWFRLLKKYPMRPGSPGRFLFFSIVNLKKSEVDKFLSPC